ncbi:uncharacterized protein [Medicago truncatula]|uniref:uncharacterized protein n=1 Tax=Medicago truncatula TaxID=3880 RepID=UPI000D2F1EB7|nr:uncharacterized protein LOC112417316 [Medicago truncatula]
MAWEEESVKECSMLLSNVILQVNVHDSWIWLIDPSRGYTVREAYRFLTDNGNAGNRTLVEDVWHKSIPTKVSVFVWRLFRNRLPTRDNLVHRRVLLIADSVCVSGDIRRHFTQFSNLVGLPRATHYFLKVIWFAYVWAIWKERNNHVFQETVCDPSSLAEKVKLNSFMWLKASHTSFIYSYYDWWKHPIPCMGVIV